tara:strand:- start:146637 stop:146780 length:144 start_codon:yes stop_codon:yes gene_type:complete
MILEINRSPRWGLINLSNKLLQSVHPAEVRYIQKEKLDSEDLFTGMA